MTRSSLAEQLQALLAYRNRPEGEYQPMQSNWTTTPANDNADPEEMADMRTERRVNMRPTVDYIMKQVATDDVERNETGQVIRIGKLRFSDGTQRERGYRLGIDGSAEPAMLRMPAGAMLGASEKQERALGGDENPQEVAASNQYFEDMLGAKHRHIPSGKPRLGKSYSHAESKAMIAEAYANTQALPAVTKCPPGLPSAGSRASDSFLGMQKASCADTGAIGWEDISTAMADRDIWAEALAELSERDRQTLDGASSARNYEDLGVTMGMSREYARRKGGKRRLRAANDNLSEIMKKVAA